MLKAQCGVYKILNHSQFSLVLLQFHALNLQAICDQQRRITWLSILAAGSTHDMQALAITHLGSLLMDPTHPFNRTGFCIYGDPAYQGMANRCRALITPFTGADVVGTREDAFNYFQSSSRMSIEGAFGELCNRWGILWRALKVDKKNWTKLLLCLVHLHNFCIDAGHRAATKVHNNSSSGDADLPGWDDPDYRVSAYYIHFVYIYLNLYFVWSTNI